MKERRYGWNASQDANTVAVDVATMDPCRLARAQQDPADARWIDMRSIIPRGWEEPLRAAMMSLLNVNVEDIPRALAQHEGAGSHSLLAGITYKERFHSLKVVHPVHRKPRHGAPTQTRLAHDQQNQSIAHVEPRKLEETLDLGGDKVIPATTDVEIVLPIPHKKVSIELDDQTFVDSRLIPKHDPS